MLPSMRSIFCDKTLISSKRNKGNSLLPSRIAPKLADCCIYLNATYSFISFSPYKCVNLFLCSFFIFCLGSLFLFLSLSAHISLDKKLMKREFVYFFIFWFNAASFSHRIQFAYLLLLPVCFHVALGTPSSLVCCVTHQLAAFYNPFFSFE